VILGGEKLRRDEDRIARCVARNCRGFQRSLVVTFHVAPLAMEDQNGALRVGLRLGPVERHQPGEFRLAGGGGNQDALFANLGVATLRVYRCGTAEAGGRRNRQNPATHTAHFSSGEHFEGQRVLVC